MTDKLDIPALRKLLATATPGPWLAELTSTHATRVIGPECIVARCINRWRADAAFIAASRNAFPALLDAADDNAMSAEATHAIRERLDAANVPRAAYIDDHVGNAIALWIQAKEENERLNAIIDHIETYHPRAVENARAAIKTDDH